MNLVGKIFTVLVFAMSLVFTTFAVCVYSTHKNWREDVMRPRNEATAMKPAGLQFQLEDVRGRNQDLKDQLEKMEGERDEEKTRARNNLVKAKSALSDAQKKNVALDDSLKTVTTERGQALTELEVTQKESKVLRTEVDGLRTSIREAEKVRDDTMDDLVKETDKAIQFDSELKRLKEQLARTLEEHADAKAVLLKFGLNADPKFYKGVKVDGLVLAVDSGGDVEISIGADDGLNKGAVLRVVRGDGSMYLGKIEVVQTWPDRAVCKIIRKEQQGAITRGDRVYSDITDK